MSNTLPTGWDTTASTSSMPVTTKIVSLDMEVSGGTTKTGVFTFDVRKQPSSTSSLLRVGIENDTIYFRYLITDKTDYDSTAATNPRLAFGDNFTEYFVMALKSLADGDPIIKVGDPYDIGALVPSIVEYVEFSMVDEKTPDVYLAICAVKEIPTAPGFIERFETNPKSSRIEDVPPWMLPAEVTLSTSEGEGLTFGFAYPTTDIDTTQTGSLREMLRKSIATSNRTVLIENTAGEPFASPPALPTIMSTLNVSRAFLRADAASVNISNDTIGTLNESDITINVGGAKVVFPAASLLVTNFAITPKIYNLQIDWLPSTKHPLGKTYGEMYYDYAGVTGSSIVVNRTGEKIVVQKPVKYIEVSASFTYKPNGFGVWIANRGYYQKGDDGKLEPGTDANRRMKERWLNKAGKFISDKDISSKLWRGYTTYTSGSGAQQLLTQILKETTTSISWAGKNDVWGGRL